MTDDCSNETETIWNKTDGFSLYKVPPGGSRSRLRVHELRLGEFFRKFFRVTRSVPVRMNQLKFPSSVTRVR